jgi:hypothetical protein
METAVNKSKNIEAPAVRVPLTQQEKDQKIVRGKFVFNEAPGGSVPIPYRRYKGEIPKVYNMQDGEIYDIPYGLARHIRDNCGGWVHAHKLDENGNPAKDEHGKRYERMDFQPLVFNVDGEFFT